MPIISSLGALTQFKSGDQPEFSIPSSPFNVTVARPPSTSPGLTQNYKLIKIDWSSPNSPGGFVTGYKVYNNTGAEVANTGPVNTTTITIPLSNIDTQFNYTVAAFNPAGQGANSIASANIKSAPNPGTNLGGTIGIYVGDALVLRNATTANYVNTNNFIANMSVSAYTGSYFLGGISMYTTYRTSSGGLLTAGGPFWSSTSCASNSRNTMTSSGVVACNLQANTYTGIAFASLT